MCCMCFWFSYVFLLSCFVVFCRRFPDDDMARSDPQCEEDQNGSNAKCLMETVFYTVCFVVVVVLVLLVVVVVVVFVVCCCCCVVDCLSFLVDWTSLD